MSTEGWIALVASLGALVTAVSTAAVLLLNARHKIRQEEIKNAVDHLREVADYQQRQLEQRDALIIQLSHAFEEASDREADCQVEVAELHGDLALMHDFGLRMAACCRRLGEDPGEAPSLPERRPRPDRREAEFRRRQLKQSTALLQESGVYPPVVPPPPAPPQSNSPP